MLLNTIFLGGQEKKYSCLFCFFCQYLHNFSRVFRLRFAQPPLPGNANKHTNKQTDRQTDGRKGQCSTTIAMQLLHRNCSLKHNYPFSACMHECSILFFTLLLTLKRKLVARQKCGNWLRDCIVKSNNYAICAQLICHPSGCYK